MFDMLPADRPAVRRLGRRLAVGLFLDVWPAWAAAGLLLAGSIALLCRLFFPAAASRLPWLWAVPLLAAIPAGFICWRRKYRSGEVVAVADWLAGGQGLLLTLLERDDRDWVDSALVEQSTQFAMPRLRPWRRLAPAALAAAFLAVVLWLPQRVPAQSERAVAHDIARDLTSTLAELKQSQLVTQEEEKALEEEIERIRRGAEERMDASSWEAADALRERVVAGLSEKQDALKWAQESLNRLTAAAEGGADAGEGKDLDVRAAELAQALDKLAKSGLLASAPPELQRLLGTAKVSGDAKAIAELSAAVSKYLAEANGRFGKLAGLGKEFGRFDPSEFPLGSGEGDDADGRPGRGGIDRGRGDAPLTWGDESMPVDRFKAQPLPPGAPRSPDDWAPLVEMPGAPQQAPVVSTPAAARDYAGTTGGAAWRRTLAPRHQSAVRKYFAK